MSKTAELRPTDTLSSFEDLCLTLCWDDDEDPETELSAGRYAVCGGEWLREADNQWRFWEDPIIAAELNRRA